MDREALLKLLRDREVVLGIAEALASLPEAAAVVVRAAGPEAVAELVRAAGPEAVAGLLKAAAASPEAAKAAAELLSRPEVASAVLKAAGPDAAAAVLKAAASSPEAVRTFLAAAASDPEAARLIAAAAAPHIAIPLNLATKEDLRQAVEELKKAVVTKEEFQRALENLVTKEDAAKFATKEDLQKFATKEDLQKFATKEDLRGFATREDVKRLEGVVRSIQAMQRRLTISIEEEAVDRVAALLRGRGLEAECRWRVRLAGVVEWDGLCLAGGLAVLVEAKVGSSHRRVERTVQRLAGLLAAPPPELAGRRLVAAHYALEYADEEKAAEAARRLRIWLIMGKKELTTLEEVLG